MASCVAATSERSLCAMLSPRAFLPALFAIAAMPVFAATDCDGSQPTPVPAAALEKLAAQYKADIAEFEAQKAAAMAQLKKAYSAALDAGETALARERADIKGGHIPMDISVNPPLDLRTARKNYREGVVRTVAKFDSLEQRIAVDYLRELAALQAHADGDAALLKQLASEKEKASSQAATEIRTAIAGTWAFKLGDQILIRELKQDGTFIAREHSKVMGKWAVSGKKVVLSWYNGGVDELLDPISAKETKGHSGIEVDFVATKEVP